MENNKGKNVLIVVLIITTLIAGGLAVYFGITGNQKQTELQAKIDKLNVQKETTVENNNEETENNKDNTSTNEEKINEKGIFAQMDAEKCINGGKDIKYKESISRSSLNNAITCSLNEDKKTATLNLNVSEINNMLNLKVSENNAEITVNGFSNEILDIYIDNLGHQAPDSEIILFLMKDGTVEYLPIVKALEKNSKSVKSFGKVKDVNGVVRLSTGNMDEYENGEISGRYSGPIAIKADGSFYNLCESINI